MKLMTQRPFHLRTQTSVTSAAPPRVNYIPYWLQWWMRPISRPLINKADRKQLGNLARLAEERAGA